MHAPGELVFDVCGSRLVVTLLDKPDRRKTDFTPDISLFRIPDVFVVGYGMDYDEHFRELPYVAEYRP